MVTYEFPVKILTPPLDSMTPISYRRRRGTFWRHDYIFRHIHSVAGAGKSASKPVSDIYDVLVVFKCTVAKSAIFLYPVYLT